jgi:hypothetical protein
MREIADNKGVLFMNRGLIRLFIIMLASAVVFAIGMSLAQTKVPVQNPPQKKVVEQQKQEEQQDYTEEEYDAYEQAVKEPDPGKRATLLIAFMEKYPKSKLQEHIVAAYRTLLFEYSKNGDYAKLEPAAEQWLKYAPNDLQTIALIAESAQKLGHHQKFIEFGGKIYAQKPSAQLAYALYQSYQKLADEAKTTEWALKLLEYPEFNDNFELRMIFVAKYAEKDLLKAAEYAQQALKSLDMATKPEATPQADWNKAASFVRRQCNNIIGMNLFGQKKYAETIPFLEKALQVECYDAGYYYIGMCQWNLGGLTNVEDAYHSFAKAELLKGPLAAQANKRCMELYKQTHNDNTTGIDKVYKKAKAEMPCGRNQ